jgi:hypothetical protein
MESVGGRFRGREWFTGRKTEDRGWKRREEKRLAEWRLWNAAVATPSSIPCGGSLVPFSFHPLPPDWAHLRPLIQKSERFPPFFTQATICDGERLRYPSRSFSFFVADFPLPFVRHASASALASAHGVRFRELYMHTFVCFCIHWFLGRGKYGGGRI